MLLWWLGLDTGRETKTCCRGTWASTEGERPRQVVLVAGPGYRERDQDMLSWCLGQQIGGPEHVVAVMQGWELTKTCCPRGTPNTFTKTTTTIFWLSWSLLDLYADTLIIYWSRARGKIMLTLDQIGYNSVTVCSTPTGTNNLYLIFYQIFSLVSVSSDDISWSC